MEILKLLASKIDPNLIFICTCINIGNIIFFVIEI